MNSLRASNIKGKITKESNIKGKIQAGVTLKGSISKAEKFREKPLIDNKTLKSVNGVLAVNTLDKVEDSELPVTSKAVKEALESAGKVKTVNGVGPDKKGNISIDTSPISSQEIAQLIITIK